MSSFSRRSSLFGLGALLVPRGLRAQAPNPADALVIVVHKDNPIQEMSLDNLRAIFMGVPVPGPDGNKYVPFNEQHGAAVRTAFDRLVLKMTPDQVGRFWIDKRIRGGPGAPRAVPGGAIRQQLVARFPSSIAYVRATEVLPLVKVIKIQGKDFRQPGYPLLG